MKVLLDTNAYIFLCKNDANIAASVQKADRLFFSFISLGELRGGFLCGTRSRNNEKTLIRFLDSSRVEILYADEQTTHHYSRLYLQLRKQGTPIPTNDVWIAALTLQHNLTLITRDAHFNNLPQIPIMP